MSIGWYRQIQNILVPYELRIIGSILSGIGFPIRVGNAYIEWTRADGKNEVIYLIWNCVGWQTFILFVLTLITGLTGRHTWLSKLETLIFGILGTYLINIFRLVIVVLVYIVVGKTLGLVFHDYFSNILSLSWLFFYWWFVYKHILEPN
jgi:exosortase/archaeosortase family protein